MNGKKQIWIIRFLGAFIFILGLLVSGSIYDSALRTNVSVGLHDALNLGESITVIITNKTGTYIIKPAINSTQNLYNNNSTTVQLSKFLLPLIQENQITLLEQLLVILGISAPFSLLILDKTEPKYSNRMLYFGLFSFFVTILDVLLILLFLGQALYGQQSVPDWVFPLVVSILMLGPAFSLWSFAEKFKSKSGET